MSDELQKAVEKYEFECKRDDEERVNQEEKAPRVGILPSSHMLAVGSSLGEDPTDTLRDFDQVYVWMKEIGALNPEFYSHYRGKPLQPSEFGALISLAFSNSYDAMRNTFSPKLQEYVIWYYTGHGHPICKSGNNKKKSPLPKLGTVGLDPTKFDSAKEFTRDLQDESVKELCLHHVGYCGLYGLIAPWIASVKDESNNCPGEKENKHLIIILDSCYAGMIARDLEELNKEEGPWNQNGCSITIQTACGPDEPTYGGYFTPRFVTLNKEQVLLDDLKQKWAKMEDEEKCWYSDLPLPSPKVVTTGTRNDTGQNNPTMEFSFENNEKMTLFSQPGFFKYCSRSVFMQQDKELSARVLTEETTRDFITNTSNFTILDYKLKTYKTGQCGGTPMGLFLIEDPRNLITEVNPNREQEERNYFAVCAHVHFAMNDTSRVGMIKLVHHKRPPGDDIVYLEDREGLDDREVNEGKHKFKYAAVAKVRDPLPRPDHWEYWEWNRDDPSTSLFFSVHNAQQQMELKDEVKNGAKLVKRCHDFVERNEAGRWNDHTKWNMTSKDKSYRGLFKQTKRSQWMEEYMKKYGES